MNPNIDENKRHLIKMLEVEWARICSLIDEYDKLIIEKNRDYKLNLQKISQRINSKIFRSVKTNYFNY